MQWRTIKEEQSYDSQCREEKLNCNGEEMSKKQVDGESP